jgi:biopolymer transport protein ExbD
MRPRRKTKEPVKVNTTALPDIIFMLLFFFMVTTVMQNQNLHTLELPEAYNVSTKENTDASDLEIYLSATNDATAFQINDLHSSIENYPAVLAQEVNRMRNNGLYIPRAYLYVDADSPMSMVNELKSELQRLDIPRVQYVHNLSGNQ